jgi:hypothetical protein
LERTTTLLVAQTKKANIKSTVLSIVPLELWLVGCSQSYYFFPVTHKNFLAYYMCGMDNYSLDIN